MHGRCGYCSSRTAGSIIVALALVAAGGTGCVRRTLTVNTEPQGALLWLNGEEVGRTPVTVDFLWYGDYEVTARMAGYQTLQTHHEIKAPWYQTPGVDFFSEVLYPGHVVDARTADFTLNPEQLPGNEQLLDNAAELRSRANATTTLAPTDAPATGPSEVPATAPIEPGAAPTAQPSTDPQVEPMSPAPTTTPPAAAPTPRTTTSPAQTPPSAPPPRSTAPAPDAPQEEEMVPAPEHPEVEDTAAPPPHS